MKTFKAYFPLIIVALLALAMSLASNLYQFFLDNIIMSLMGFFFCLLAMFKLFDLHGFADGFQMYDIIAKQVRFYAYAYPFVELSLGLSYLAKTAPVITNLVTLLLMSISAVGVIKSVRAGMNISCACLGTVLKVPLSTVSIVENIAMGLMAGLNLIFLLAV